MVFTTGKEVRMTTNANTSPGDASCKFSIAQFLDSSGIADIWQELAMGDGPPNKADSHRRRKLEELTLACRNRTAKNTHKNRP